MTEEEKKAIKIVKEIWQFTDYSTDKIALKVVLDLIEKLQKENVELKEKQLIDRAMIEDSISKGIVERDYIPKDKIIEEIQILMSNKVYDDDLSIDYTHNDLMDSAIAALEELLEEE